MTDDPRDILQAAGVECAEVDAWYEPWTYSEEVDVSAASEKAEDAFLALARLVAKQGWMLESICARASTGTWYAQIPWTSKEEMLADLDRRWKEHNADPDA